MVAVANNSFAKKECKDQELGHTIDMYMTRNRIGKLLT